MKAGLKDRGIDHRRLKAEDRGFQENSTGLAQRLIGNERYRQKAPRSTTGVKQYNQFAIGASAQPIRNMQWRAARERAESFRAERI